MTVEPDNGSHTTLTFIPSPEPPVPEIVHVPAVLVIELPTLAAPSIADARPVAFIIPEFVPLIYVP